MVRAPKLGAFETNTSAVGTMKKPGNRWKSAHSDLFASDTVFVNALREVLGLAPLPGTRA